jgi:hypothetical protein
MFIRQRIHKIVNNTTSTTHSFPHSNTCDEQHTQNIQEFVEFNAPQGQTRVRLSCVSNNRENLSGWQIKLFCFEASGKVFDILQSEWDRRWVSPPPLPSPPPSEGGLEQMNARLRAIPFQPGHLVYTSTNKVQTFSLRLHLFSNNVLCQHTWR